jgi:hypothetical protein
VTIRIMEVLGYDIPHDLGGYYEPIRLDVAAELQQRAERRPRFRERLDALLRAVDREP